MSPFDDVSASHARVLLYSVIRTAVGTGHRSHEVSVNRESALSTYVVLYILYCEYRYQ